MATKDKLGPIKKYGTILGLIIMAFTSWDYISDSNNWGDITEEILHPESERDTTEVVIFEPEINMPDLTSNPMDVKEGEEERYKPKDTAEEVKNTTITEVKSLRVASWNMLNIGNGKSDEEVTFMAKIMKSFDVIAVQEISTKIGGPRAIVKFNDELSRTGAKWDYVISNPTSGAGSERYAYLWKTDKMFLKGRAWLTSVQDLDEKIDREPFMARFVTHDGKSVLLANLHAVPTSKKPQEEIIHLDILDKAYGKDNLMVMGDFNLSQKHKAWDPLKSRGFEPVLVGQKTSLRRIEKEGDYFAQEYDNIFIESDELDVEEGGIVDFIRKFKTLKEARSISDHVPVWCEIKWKKAS